MIIEGVFSFLCFRYSDQYNQEVAEGLKVELEQEFGVDFSRPLYSSKLNLFAV